MSKMVYASTREERTAVMFGLGANLDAPVVQLSRAIASMRDAFEIDRISSVYRSEPVGHTEQPDFYNLVCSATTDLAPELTLRAIGEIEQAIGKAATFLNGPRLIDIDLLSYGELVIDTSNLAVPHPRLHRRAFVLLPLREIAPEWRHPTLGQTADEMLIAGGRFERIERWGSLPGWTAAS